MSKIDQEFLDLCETITSEGREYENKNRGVKRLQIPSYTFKHSFKDGFPAISMKRLWWNAVRTELLWFLRGDTDVKYLNDNRVDIWNKDAYNWYKKSVTSLADTVPFEEFIRWGRGSVGRNYSAQWRDFQGVDQIDELIKGMKKDIMSSRLKVNAWNPAEIHKTALPPCHSEFQVIGVPLTRQERIEYARSKGINLALTMSTEELDKMSDIPEFGFELHWNQRSVDTFLGLPFNIASYGLLAKVLELITGYPALGIEGTLKCVHFYDNQYEAVEELMTRATGVHENCEVAISVGSNFHKYVSGIDQIEMLEPKNIKLVGYTSDEAIKVEMLAPNEL